MGAIRLPASVPRIQRLANPVTSTPASAPPAARRRSRPRTSSREGIQSRHEATTRASFMMRGRFLLGTESNVHAKCTFIDLPQKTAATRSPRMPDGPYL